MCRQYRVPALCRAPDHVMIVRAAVEGREFGRSVPAVLRDHERDGSGYVARHQMQPGCVNAR